MKRKLLAAAMAAALLCTAQAASALASATVTFDTVRLSQPVSGAYATLDELGLSLQPQETATLTVSYTVDLQADGLAATRDWEYCTPVLFPMVCGPQPTGSEAAEAVVAWAIDSRSSDYYMIDFTPTEQVQFDLASGVGHYTGVMTFTATNNDAAPHWVPAGLLGAVFVDASLASPVPEPANYALLLGGLAGLALRRRR